MVQNEGHTVCRLCLVERSALIYVFECKGNLGWSAADAITELLRLQVSSDDIYPQCVCKECMGKLEEFKSFKHVCEQNKELLDRAYAAKRGLLCEEVPEGRREGLVKGQNGLDSSDKTVSFECDPLDLTDLDIKPDIEDDSPQLMKSSHAESVGTSNHVNNSIKEEDESGQALSPKSEVCNDDNYISESAKLSEMNGIPTDDATSHHPSSADIPESASTCYGPDGLPVLKSDPEGTIDVKSDCSHSSGTVQPENVVITMDMEELADNSTTSDVEYVNTETSGVSNADRCIFSCDECGTGFNDKVTLQNHIESHYLGSNNVLDRCISLETDISDPLMVPVILVRYYNGNNEHIPCRRRKKGDEDMNFEPGERFFCKFCKKEFAGRRNLRAHLKIHDGVKPFSCHVCNKQFLRREHLKVHSTVHSGERPFLCNICGRGFSRLNKLKLHLLTHSGERPFKCPHCDKGFSRSDTLKQHERTHSGEKPFVCLICGRGFAHSSDLKCHVAIHSIDKPFKCKDCDKAFNQKRDLRKHERTHSGNRPFKCDECPEEFLQNNQLKHHKMMHSGEKPFKCGQCGRGFTKATDLRKHEKLHSGIKPFGCPTCHKFFPRKTSLKRHLLTHSTSKDSRKNEQIIT